MPGKQRCLYIRGLDKRGSIYYIVLACFLASQSIFFEQFKVFFFLMIISSQNSRKYIPNVVDYFSEVDN